ncbi:MAG TPA: lytic transglycosylase domain-containing protein [Bryobacteraceae bacterium]|jgi:soluble lytic murein transglycosylase-like protein|nr:lytic transglycosylase domain-containing protein [Bryobacteraceae bacterium]
MRSLLSLLLWTAGAAFAGEYAVLESGARLHIDHHEIDGAKARLFNGGGSIELDASQVRAFEVEEDAPRPAAIPDDPSAPPALSPEQLADGAAERYGLPPQLVRSVMKVESGFAPQAVSPKGAIGLMQLMPATAQSLGADPHDPAANVDAGVRYLRELLEKYNGGLRHALAAYNAGPAAVEKYQGIPPYRETMNYIRRVEQDFKKAE